MCRGDMSGAEGVSEERNWLRLRRMRVWEEEGPTEAEGGADTIRRRRRAGGEEGRQNTRDADGGPVSVLRC